MNPKIDYVVFMGRFAPFHLGHLSVIQRAFELADTVVLLIGSSHRARSYRNPFTFEERRDMILNTVTESGMLLSGKRLAIEPLCDDPYNDTQWSIDAGRAVDTALNKLYGWSDMPSKVGALIGHKKDSTSYYLDMFQQWKLIDHPMDDRIDATRIRQLYFEGVSSRFYEAAVPPYVFKWLQAFRDSPAFNDMVAEYEFVKRYKQQWSVAPYPVTFVTTDCVVVQSGHVLMVQRKSFPGRGLWALPGGFLEQDERIVDGAIRELIEETSIDVPEKVLRGNIVYQHTFDHPDRSSRGRTITTAVLINLPPGKLPKVRGQDSEVSAVQWKLISSLKDDQTFEDHSAILKLMLRHLDT